MKEELDNLYMELAKKKRDKFVSKEWDEKHTRGTRPCDKDREGLSRMHRRGGWRRLVWRNVLEQPIICLSLPKNMGIIPDLKGQ